MPSMTAKNDPLISETLAQEGEEEKRKRAAGLGLSISIPRKSCLYSAFTTKKKRGGADSRGVPYDLDHWKGHQFGSGGMPVHKGKKRKKKRGGASWFFHTNHQGIRGGEKGETMTSPPLVSEGTGHDFRCVVLRL